MTREWLFALATHHERVCIKKEVSKVMLLLLPLVGKKLFHFLLCSNIHAYSQHSKIVVVNPLPTGQKKSDSSNAGK